MLDVATRTCADNAHEGMVSDDRVQPGKRRSTVEPINPGAMFTERELDTWLDDGGRGWPAP
jgi:hypothetical protein